MTLKDYLNEYVEFSFADCNAPRWAEWATWVIIIADMALLIYASVSLLTWYGGEM